MFLCDACHLEETSTNSLAVHPPIERSIGACESCRIRTVCVDCHCFTYAQVIVDLPADNDARREVVDDLLALRDELE